MQSEGYMRHSGEVTRAVLRVALASVLACCACAGVHESSRSRPSTVASPPSHANYPRLYVRVIGGVEPTVTAFSCESGEQVLLQRVRFFSVPGATEDDHLCSGTPYGRWEWKYRTYARGVCPRIVLGSVYVVRATGRETGGVGSSEMKVTSGEWGELSNNCPKRNGSVSERRCESGDVPCSETR